jgi:nitronate monooxygenase
MMKYIGRFYMEMGAATATFAMVSGTLDAMLLTRLGILNPIIQAPMAGVSTPALAAAVSNAGGLGSLGIGASTPEAARTMIRETRRLTGRPFNVNVFTHPPAVQDRAREARWLDWLAPQFAQFGAQPPASLREIYTSFIEDAATLSMLLEERPAVVSFHFGLPSDAIIGKLRSAGIELMATATNVDEARAIERRDIGVIIAQGAEAGGHRGTFDATAADEYLGTMALTRLLVRLIDRPIVAAGGIMDGAGIVAAMALGAGAVQLGTAFLLCPESAIDDGYRHALLNPTLRTAFTTSISGRPARSLENDFTAMDRDPQRPLPPSYPIAYDAGKALHTAAKLHGRFGFGAQWAGQAALLSRALPAATLVATLEQEMQAAAQELQSRFFGMTP